VQRSFSVKTERFVKPKADSPHPLNWSGLFLFEDSTSLPTPPPATVPILADLFGWPEHGLQLASIVRVERDDDDKLWRFPLRYD
jgi:hypothetical protein